MSLDRNRLHQALQLFGVDYADGDHEVITLAELLAVPEEVLPWLALRANAFAEDEKLDRALREAASRASSASTNRRPSYTPTVALHQASRDLDEALEELIRKNVEAHEGNLRADACLSELVRMSAASHPAQAQNHIPVRV